MAGLGQRFVNAVAKHSNTIAKHTVAKQCAISGSPILHQRLPLLPPSTYMTDMGYLCQSVYCDKKSRLVSTTDMGYPCQSTHQWLKGLQQLSFFVGTSYVTLQYRCTDKHLQIKHLQDSFVPLTWVTLVSRSIATTKGFNNPLLA